MLKLVRFNNFSKNISFIDTKTISLINVNRILLEIEYETCKRGTSKRKLYEVIAKNSKDGKNLALKTFKKLDGTSYEKKNLKINILSEERRNLQCRKIKELKLIEERN